MANNLKARLERLKKNQELKKIADAHKTKTNEADTNEANTKDEKRTTITTNSARSNEDRLARSSQENTDSYFKRLGFKKLYDSVYERTLTSSDLGVNTKLHKFLDSIDIEPFLCRFKNLTRKTANAQSKNTRVLAKEKFVFFDTETTGLSSGSGTVAFLVSRACFTNGVFTLTQFFLSDYDGEESLLKEFFLGIPSDSVLVSYNGRTFDEPLMRSRCIMNGIIPKSYTHLDLVYPVRRLFSSELESCALKEIEKSLLSINRVGDVDGSEIPDIYLSFLKQGYNAKIETVIHHNALDILTLPLVVMYLNDIFVKYSHLASCNPVNLARILLATENVEKAEKVLTLALKKVSELKKDQILLYSGLLFFKQNRYTEAAFMYGSIKGSARALFELAKIESRINKNRQNALMYIEEALKLEVPEKLKNQMLRFVKTLENDNRTIKEHKEILL